MADMAMAEAAPGVMPRVGRPKGIQYRNVAPFGLRAISRQIKFYPTQSGSYSYTGQNTIQIPIVGSTGFLDAQNSFVHFRVRNTSRQGTAAGVDQGPAAVVIDQSAYSLFNRYRVIGSMGDEVERIDRFNKLMSVLTDYNMTPAHRATMASQVQGTNSTLVGLQGNNTAVAPANAGIAIEPDGTIEICLPIATGLFAQDKYIPLGLVRGAGLRLEFLLEDPELCLMQIVNTVDAASVSTGAANLAYRAAANSYPLSNGYTIDQVYYTGRVIEFEGININERLVADMQATGRPLIMRGVSFDYASTSAAPGGGDDQHLFNLRARSVKAIMSFPDVAEQVYDITRGLYGESTSPVSHPVDDGTAAAETGVGTLKNLAGGTGFTAAQLRRLFPSISCRPNYEIRRFQYTVGNLQMPPQFIEFNAERSYGEPRTNGVAGVNGTAQIVYEFPQALESSQETFNRFNDSATSTSVVRQNVAVSYGMLAPKLSTIDASIGLDLTRVSTVTGGATPQISLEYLTADVVSKFLMAINTDSYLHDQSVVDSGFDTASQGLSIVLRTQSADRSGVITLAPAALATTVSRAFSYTMLHYTMNEVFYEIDLNGQVIKAQ